jgi:hypothetical protein
MSLVYTPVYTGVLNMSPHAYETRKHRLILSNQNVTERSRMYRFRMDILVSRWRHIDWCTPGVHRLALGYPPLVYRRCTMTMPRVYMYMHTGVP